MPDDWKITVFEPNGQSEDLPPDTVLRATFKFGRFRCTMTFDCSRVGLGASIGSIPAEWEPHFPKHLSKRDIREYQAGRNALYQRAANIAGGKILLAE